MLQLTELSIQPRVPYLCHHNIHVKTWIYIYFSMWRRIAAHTIKNQKPHSLQCHLWAELLGLVLNLETWTGVLYPEHSGAILKQEKLTEEIVSEFSTCGFINCFVLNNGNFWSRKWSSICLLNHQRPRRVMRPMYPKNFSTWILSLSDPLNFLRSTVIDYIKQFLSIISYQSTIQKIHNSGSSLVPYL